MYPPWDSSIPRNLDGQVATRGDTVEGRASPAGRGALSSCVLAGHVITFAQYGLAPGWDTSTWRLP
jgi:hypothetical protein